MRTSSRLAAFLLLLDLEKQSAIDVREDTTERDGGADQRVELFVTTNGELQMPGSNALDLQVFGRVSGKFKDFGR